MKVRSKLTFLIKGTIKIPSMGKESHVAQKPRVELHNPAGKPHLSNSVQILEMACWVLWACCRGGRETESSNHSLRTQNWLITNFRAHALLFSCAGHGLHFTHMSSSDTEPHLAVSTWNLSRNKMEDNQGRHLLPSLAHVCTRPHKHICTQTQMLGLLAGWDTRQGFYSFTNHYNLYYHYKVHYLGQNHVHKTDSADGTLSFARKVQLLLLSAILCCHQQCWFGVTPSLPW